MTTKPTCETCQAWVPTPVDNALHLGECWLNPPAVVKKHPCTGNDVFVRIRHYNGQHCMQHRPIEAVCEHEYMYPNGIPTCTKCRETKPLTVAELTPVNGGIFADHVDDHSLEGKLKDAYGKLGKANERIKELQAKLDVFRPRHDPTSLVECRITPPDTFSFCRCKLPESGGAGPVRPTNPVTECDSSQALGRQHNFQYVDNRDGPHCMHCGVAGPRA